jgi:hypothetical protein
MGNVHWNRDTHQSKAIKGMGWSTKSLQNNCWRFFVRLSLPPEISMSGLEKNSLSIFSFPATPSLIWVKRTPPSSEAHLGLFGGEKKVSEQKFRRPHYNHLTSTSREGLRQVYDDMYKFLLVTNFGGR